MHWMVFIQLVQLRIAMKINTRTAILSFFDSRNCCNALNLSYLPNPKKKKIRQDNTIVQIFTLFLLLTNSNEYVLIGHTQVCYLSSIFDKETHNLQNEDLRFMCVVICVLPLSIFLLM